MKWAGRTIDVVKILLVSTHNYFRNTYLHISELEKSPIVICISSYDQSYSCNTPLSPHAYVLNLWVTLSFFRWKLGNPCLLLLFYSACLNHPTAITVTTASLLIYRCGIFVFPLSRTINLGNTSQRRFQWSPILVSISWLEKNEQWIEQLAWKSLPWCLFYRRSPS